MRLSTLSLASISILFCAGFPPARAHDHAHMMQMHAAQPLSGASVYNLSSRWTDQDGKTVELKSLSGKPVVIAMAYTSCKDICPLIVANMVAIEKAAKAEWRIDGIVADNRLGPGLTGVEASMEIRRRAGRAIPTLILTGDTSAERIAEIRSCGFELLHKPVSDHELRSEIATMIFRAN